MSAESTTEPDASLEAADDEICAECDLPLEECVCEDEDAGDDSEDDDIDEPDEEPELNV